MLSKSVPSTKILITYESSIEVHMHNLGISINMLYLIKHKLGDKIKMNEWWCVYLSVFNETNKANKWNLYKWIWGWILTRTPWKIWLYITSHSSWQSYSQHKVPSDLNFFLLLLSYSAFRIFTNNIFSDFYDGSLLKV